VNDHGCNQCLVVADGDWIDTVVDGRNVYGINFLPTQDLADDTFSVSEFIWLLRNGNLPTISVDTAHRHNDPNAKYPNFNFATSGVDLSQYGVIWLIAYEGNNDGFNHGNPITTDEVAAITKFMDTGGDVFATGDHSGMGAYLSGQIPRVSSMRKWFGLPHAREFSYFLRRAAYARQRHRCICALGPGRSSILAWRRRCGRDELNVTNSVFDVRRGFLYSIRLERSG
jgi:hypothetical protein